MPGRPDARARRLEPEEERHVGGDSADAGGSQEAALLSDGGGGLAAPAGRALPRDPRPLQPAQAALRADDSQGPGRDVAVARRSALGAGSLAAARDRSRDASRLGSHEEDPG